MGVPNTALSSIVQPLVSSSLPFENPVLIFELAMAIFLIAPLTVERIRLPGIIGVILVGALIGPNVLGLLKRGDTIVLGTVGLVYLNINFNKMIGAHSRVPRREVALY